MFYPSRFSPYLFLLRSRGKNAKGEMNQGCSVHIWRRSDAVKRNRLGANSAVPRIRIGPAFFFEGQSWISSPRTTWVHGVPPPTVCRTSRRGDRRHVTTICRRVSSHQVPFKLSNEVRWSTRRTNRESDFLSSTGSRPDRPVDSRTSPHRAFVPPQPHRLAGSREQATRRRN